MDIKVAVSEENSNVHRRFYILAFVNSKSVLGKNDRHIIYERVRI